MDPNAPKPIGGPLWQLLRIGRQMRDLLALPEDLDDADRDAAVREILGDAEADRLAAAPPMSREEALTVFAEAIYALRGEKAPPDPAAELLAELEAEAREKVVPLRAVDGDLTRDEP